MSETALWQMLGGHVEAALQAHGVPNGARVIWLPSGLTDVIPIGLARAPADGHFLLDRYEFVTIPSLHALGRSPSAAPPTLAAVVNPTNNLLFTPAEGALVSSHFDGAARTVIGADQATSADAVLTALAGHSYWHLSGHGRFDWLHPDTSGFVLAGGATLSIERLLAHLGAGGTAPRLVVLSACESGMADISEKRREEFIGLPTALLAGGAQAVLSTQWRVDDLATMFLIARFYDLHLGPDHLSPSTALRQAQFWLRGATTADLRSYIQDALDQHRLDLVNAALVRDAGLARYADDIRPFADPVYWAGFTLTGL